MKSIIRKILINFFSLFIIAKISGAIDYSDDFVVLLWASILLVFLNLIIKPLLNLILMPINLLTLGGFKWVINVVVLLLVSLFLVNFKILEFSFPGFSFGGFTLPSLHLPFFWSIFLVSFLIEIITSAFSWIFE